VTVICSKTTPCRKLLDELDVIERFEQPGSQSRVGEMAKKQMNLYTLLRVAVPS